MPFPSSFCLLHPNFSCKFFMLKCLFAKYPFSFGYLKHMIISKWAYPAVLTMYQMHRLSLPFEVQDKAELTAGTEPAGTNGRESRSPYIVPLIMEVVAAL